MNVLSDKLEPQTFGQFVDALILANIRMWHAQEVVYETETLEKMSRDEMFHFLKQSTWLNLERNFAMDNLDAALARQISEKHPNVSLTGAPMTLQAQPPLWEQA